MVAETDYLTSGQIHFTGLGSGTDFETMIQKLVEIEGTRIKRLEARKQDIQAKIDAFQELNSSMLSLKSTLSGMDTMKEFFIKTATSSNESLLTASASSDAEEGTHTIDINQLAQNDIEMNNNGYSDSSAVINSSGSTKIFSYTYNSTTVSIDVPDGTTLEGLVNLVNQDADNPGVRASLIFDGTNYYFQLRGLDLGDKYEVTIETDATDPLTGFTTTDFTETQDAQNSQIRVDGWPTTTWIERETNSINDVITGLTLNLKDTGTVKITVTNDNEAIKEQIRTFVDQVNTILTLIKEQSKVDPVSQKGSVLTGNYGLNMIQEQIKNILAAKGIGFDYNEDTYPSLSNIGITTDAQTGSPTLGLLLLDESKLDEALQKDPQAVAEIFSADLVPATNTSNFRYYSHIDGLTEGGIYDVTYSVDSTGAITSATIDGEPASISNNIITSMNGSSKGLAIQVDNLTQGDYSGQIRLKKGKTGELIEKLEELTDSYNGPLHIMEDNYNDTIDNLDKKIAWEQKRIDNFERSMRNRYARLEALLGYYDSLSNALSAQVSSLSTKSK
jgi:flagellar hook-associated protein 2